MVFADHQHSRLLLEQLPYDIGAEGPLFADLRRCEMGLLERGRGRSMITLDAGSVAPQVSVLAPCRSISSKNRNTLPTGNRRLLNPVLAQNARPFRCNDFWNALSRLVAPFPCPSATKQTTSPSEAPAHPSQTDTAKGSTGSQKRSTPFPSK